MSVSTPAAVRQDKAVSLRLRIPAELHDQPVLSALVREFNLHLNIVSALLSQTDRASGWFHVTLQGSDATLQAALAWLEDRRVDFWLEQSQSDW